MLFTTSIYLVTAARTAKLVAQRLKANKKTQNVWKVGVNQAHQRKAFNVKEKSSTTQTYWDSFSNLAESALPQYVATDF